MVESADAGTTRPAFPLSEVIQAEVRMCSPQRPRLPAHGV
jgi:hypothetical protein